jgi:hypothetical protein
MRWLVLVAMLGCAPMPTAEVPYRPPPVPVAEVPAPAASQPTPPARAKGPCFDGTPPTPDRPCLLKDMLFLHEWPADAAREALRRQTFVGICDLWKRHGQQIMLLEKQYGRPVVGLTTDGMFRQVGEPDFDRVIPNKAGSETGPGALMQWSWRTCAEGAGCLEQQLWFMRFRDGAPWTFMMCQWCEPNGNCALAHGGTSQ